jgi:hypothetical protein
VAIWEYDKRPVNGANFVYYGMRLVGSDTKKAKEMIAYADKVRVRTSVRVKTSVRVRVGLGLALVLELGLGLGLRVVSF